MIATLVFFGTRTSQSGLVIALAWGTVVGSALQFGIQIPFVLKYAPRIRLSLQTSLPHVRTVIRSFGPVVISRGVVQLSGYVDQIIASWLGTAAVAGLAYAQTIYFLPISLFGMSVAAAELPQMSGAVGTEDEINTALRKRLERGLRQIAFFVVPTVTAFIFIGRVLVAALYQSGQFRSDDTLYVWYILVGSTFGLLAVTLGRLYSSAFYALRDPKTPLRFAMVRVTLTAVLGLLFAFPLRPYIIDLIMLLHMPVPNLPEGSEAPRRDRTDRIGRNGGLDRVRHAPPRAGPPHRQRQTRAVISRTPLDFRTGRRDRRRGLPPLPRAADHAPSPVPPHQRSDPGVRRIRSRLLRRRHPPRHQRSASDVEAVHAALALRATRIVDVTASLSMRYDGIANHHRLEQ